METLKKDDSIEEMEFWEILSRLDPASPARLPLARACLDRDYPEKALNIVRPVTEAHPYHRQAALMKTRALLALGRHREAEGILSEAEEWIEEIAGMLSEMARQLRKVDKNSLAYKAETAAGMLDPKSKPHPYLVAKDNIPETESMRMEAASLVAVGKIGQAVRTYRGILDIDPRNEDVRAALAELTGYWPQPDESYEPGPPGGDGGREAKMRVIRKLERLRDAARRRREKVQATL